MKKLNLAIIGQGRSGKDIHGKFCRSELNTHFTVKYVVDEDARRRAVSEEIYPGCRTFADYRELFALDDVDLVVNATYSDLHYPIAKDLLQHKFNVLVEKPMARTRYECDDLIKTAKDNGVLLAVFQQSFYAPYYQKIKQIVDSGVLGTPMQVNIVFSGFTRRWDWQTLQRSVGGGLYNTGPHPVGLALGFLDFSPETKVVYSRLGKAMTSGDSDDTCKILLEAPGKPLVDLEINSNDAYPAWNFKVMGSRGTLYSNTKEYKLTYIVDGENPERPVERLFLQKENGDPVFCKEALVKHEESGAFEAGSAFTTAVAGIYQEIYDALTAGKPMTITAETGREIVSIIERVHAENPLPLIY